MIPSPPHPAASPDILAIIRQKWRLCALSVPPRHFIDFTVPQGEDSTRWSTAPSRGIMKPMFTGWQTTFMRRNCRCLLGAGASAQHFLEFRHGWGFVAKLYVPWLHSRNTAYSITVCGEQRGRREG
jgi:hypothetical protein